MIGCFRY